MPGHGRMLKNIFWVRLLLYYVYVVVRSYFVMTLNQIQGSGKNVVLVTSKSCGTNFLAHAVC